MKWPWSRTEIRQQATGFTDLTIAGLFARASGQALYTATATAAVESAAIIWSSALAGATVIGDSRAQTAVTRRFLSLTGREWIRRGEAIHVIGVTDRGIELLPASSWDVSGGPSPGNWLYRCDVFAPSSVNTVHVPRASVVHSQWAVNSEEPWRGRSPWSLANLSAGLLTALERRLAQEADLPVGGVIPYPANPKLAGQADPQLDALKAGIGALEGEYAFVETLSAGLGRGMSEAPKGAEWRPERLGANPPDVLRALRKDAHEAILGACGIPPALVSEAPGTATREALRRFVTGVVEAKAGELADVLSEALETQVSFSFRSTWAHDLMGRTGAYSKLVAAGMDAAQAKLVSGLDDI